MSACEIMVRWAFEVWFTQGDLICWVPREELKEKLGAALETLHGMGFTVTRKQIEKELKDSSRI